LCALESSEGKREIGKMALERKRDGHNLKNRIRNWFTDPRILYNHSKEIGLCSNIKITNR